MAIKDVIIGYVKGPKGDKGDKGNIGATGAIGPTGPQGPLPPLIANYLATAAGQGALDAYVGKLIDQRLTELSNGLTALNGEIVIIQKVYRADQSGIIEILFETPFLHAQYHISVTQLFSETPYLYSVLYTSTAGFKIKVSDTSGNAKPNLDIALNVLAVIK